MSKGVCPNCHRPHNGLFTTAPMGPNGAGVVHCGCFWEGDAEGKDYHHSTTTAEQHAWMRGERSEDDVSEQSKVPVKGYVVRGTDEENDPVNESCPTLGYAINRWAEYAGNGVEGTAIGIFAVAEDGTETPLPSYEEAVNKLSLLREMATAALDWQRSGGMRPNHPPELAGCPAGALREILRIVGQS